MIISSTIYNNCVRYLETVMKTTNKDTMYRIWKERLDEERDRNEYIRKITKIIYNMREIVINKDEKYKDDNELKNLDICIRPRCEKYINGEYEIKGNEYDYFKYSLVVDNLINNISM